jgi:hypothetical protein
LPADVPPVPPLPEEMPPVPGLLEPAAPSVPPVPPSPGSLPPAAGEPEHAPFLRYPPRATTQFWSPFSCPANAVAMF